MNGIINIITKKAADTQGTCFQQVAAVLNRDFFGARHGGKINDDTFYRFYAKGFTRDQMKTTIGEKCQ